MKAHHSFLLTLFCVLFPFSVFAAPVNINNADAAAIDAAMKGVGAKSAAAIVAYRTKNGPFKRVDDLTNVKGIGPKIVEKNRANLTIGEPASSSELRK
jgi:competence protein ComEA